MKLLKQINTLFFFLALTNIMFAQATIDEGVIELNNELEDEAQVETVTYVVQKTEIIEVNGISKNNREKDIATIANQLKSMSGVINCRVSKRGKFFVTFKPQQVDRQKIIAKVERIPSNTNSKIKAFKVKN